MKVEICVEIEWPCPHCGHLQEQQVTVAFSKGIKKRPQAPTLCRLACSACGHQSPLQIFLDTVPGVAIRTPSTVFESWLSEHHHYDEFIKSWHGAVRNPCPN